MTEAEELRAAAAKLRATATAALLRPDGWDQSTPTWHASSDLVVNDHNDAVAVTWGPAKWPERDWIAMMCPAMAEPLAGWLEVEAERVEDGYRTNGLPHGLAFARLVLREPQS